MDKSLRKLSKAELRELLVDLSDENEKLLLENQRLRRMLSQQRQQRLPRNATVGSIAQAALQANGYFEAAQRSADEYLREIKHLRDELVLRSKRVPVESHDIISSAQMQAQAKAQAQLQAQKIVNDAQVRAHQIVTSAQKQAQETVARANAHATQLRSAGAHSTQGQAQTQVQPQSQQVSKRRADPAHAQEGQTTRSDRDVARQTQRGRRFPAHAAPDSSLGMAQRGMYPSAAGSR